MPVLGLPIAGEEKLEKWQKVEQQMDIAIYWLDAAASSMEKALGNLHELKSYLYEHVEEIE